MPYVKCPSCGERGKIPPTLVGARIKCKRCSVSFLVSPPAAKATAGPAAGLSAAVVETPDGIAVEGLDASTWTLSTETGVALNAEATVEPDNQPAASAGFVAAGTSPEAHEYKVLTPKTNTSMESSTWPGWRKPSTISAGRAGPSSRCRRRTSRGSRAGSRRRSWSCSSGRPSA